MKAETAGKAHSDGNRFDHGYRGKFPVFLYNFFHLNERITAMKIGVSSYSFRALLQRGMTYFEACDQALAMGYDGIEFIDLDLNFAPAEKSIEELASHLKAYCAQIGLEIPAYTVSADFLRGRGCTPEEESERICQCADIAALLGAKVLRHDAFWALDGLRDWRDGVDRVVPGIRHVADYAQKLGIRTCTENHGRIMQDSDRMVYLMRAVGHDNYGWLVDIGNFLCADEDPCHAVGIAAPYAVHAHVKDFLFKSGQEEMPVGGWFGTRGGNYLRGTVVGHGVVPVRACLRILKNANYAGYLSVEFEGREETLPALKDAREFLRQTLD